MFSSIVFYERLSMLCRQQATSITLFAKNVLQISTSAPTNWKNGTVPSAEILYRCAREFNVSADYLLGLTDAQQPLAKGQLTEQETALIRKLRLSDPRAREVAQASMHAVLDACSTQQEETL